MTLATDVSYEENILLVTDAFFLALDYFLRILNILYVLLKYNIVGVPRASAGQIYDLKTVQAHGWSADVIQHYVQ